MSIATLILGNSGTGKSTSLRNLDPNNTFLIQCINKPLPFRSHDWKIKDTDNPDGNIFQTSDTAKILKCLAKAPHDVIIIDDYQATMVNEIMSRNSEKSFNKYNDVGKNAWDIFIACGNLPKHKRVYLLGHTNADENGNIKMKTVGKLVDNMLVPESYFTVVLRTDLINGNYVFRTQTNGADCCKSPYGMFSDELIDNDLKMVDDVICEFENIPTKTGGNS